MLVPSKNTQQEILALPGFIVYVTVASTVMRKIISHLLCACDNTVHAVGVLDLSVLAIEVVWVRL